MITENIKFWKTWRPSVSCPSFSVNGRRLRFSHLLGGTRALKQLRLAAVSSPRPRCHRALLQEQPDEGGCAQERPRRGLGRATVGVGGGQGACTDRCPSPETLPCGLRTWVLKINGKADLPHEKVLASQTLERRPHRPEGPRTCSREQWPAPWRALLSVASVAPSAPRSTGPRPPH